MRINKYVSTYTHLSRRQADEAIAAGRVTISKKRAMLGDNVSDEPVTLDNVVIEPGSSVPTTVVVNKPVGYVCSRDGQGSPTVYDLLPDRYETLNIAGRLDKDSSGLVILTNDGDLLFSLTHPSKQKQKTYLVTLNRQLTPDECEQLSKGVDIGDERLSRFDELKLIQHNTYEVVLSEGRNRQIRRSITAVGAKVMTLHRVALAHYRLPADVYEQV